MTTQRNQCFSVLPEGSPAFEAAQLALFEAQFPPKESQKPLQSAFCDSPSTRVEHHFTFDPTTEVDARITEAVRRQARHLRAIRESELSGNVTPPAEITSS